MPFPLYELVWLTVDSGVVYHLFDLMFKAFIDEVLLLFSCRGFR
jgi:hypothetical protein